MITKKLREQLYDKFGGCCAYCGKALNGKMHVDHIVPVHRGWDGEKERLKVQATIGHLHPSCRRCNNYKNVLALEDFRIEVSQQVQRSRRYSLNFRLAEDFGLVVEVKKPVVFYFETFNLVDGGGHAP